MWHACLGCNRSFIQIPAGATLDGATCIFLYNWKQKFSKCLTEILAKSPNRATVKKDRADIVQEKCTSADKYYLHKAVHAVFHIDYKNAIAVQ